MKILLFLGSVLLVVASVDSDTVIMKSGKKLDGTLMSEDSSRIVFKDKSGIVLSLKKSTLDLEAMEAANKVPPAITKQTEQVDDDAAVNHPAQTKPSEAKPRKIYTNEDVNGLPEISDFGSGSTGIEESKGEQQKKPQVVSATPHLDENYWRKEAYRLHSNISILEEDYKDMEHNCLSTGGHDSFEWSSGWPSQRLKNRWCEKSEALKVRLEGERDRLLEFEDRARAENVPKEWLREGE